MVVIVLSLLFALGVSAVVMTYVAYPYRGLETPFRPRVGEVMRKGVEALPTLDPEEDEGEDKDHPTDHRGAA